MLFFCQVLVFASAYAQESNERVDIVLVKAEDWNGVDVYDNTKPHSEPRNYKYGQKWQCVELVQRLYAKKWHYPSIWPVKYAYEMFDNAPVGIERHQNGDLSGQPVWGDAIIFDQEYPGAYGHVSIVTDVRDGQVFLVHQNYGNGRASITIDEQNNLGQLGVLKPIGWLHPAHEYNGPEVITGGGISNSVLLILLVVTAFCCFVAMFITRFANKVVHSSSGLQMGGFEGESRDRLLGRKTRMRLVCVPGIIISVLMLIACCTIVFLSVISGHNELVPYIDIGRNLVRLETRFMLLIITGISISAMLTSIIFSLYRMLKFSNDNAERKF